MELMMVGGLVAVLVLLYRRSGKSPSDRVTIHPVTNAGRLRLRAYRMVRDFEHKSGVRLDNTQRFTLKMAIQEELLRSAKTARTLPKHARTRHIGRAAHTPKKAA